MFITFLIKKNYKIIEHGHIILFNNDSQKHDVKLVGPRIGFGLNMFLVNWTNWY